MRGDIIQIFLSFIFVAPCTTLPLNKVWYMFAMQLVLTPIYRFTGTGSFLPLLVFAADGKMTANVGGFRFMSNYCHERRIFPHRIFLAYW